MNTPRPDFRKRATKIVATLGPASSGLQNIRKLADAGVDVFRLNFSHGDREAHAANIGHIREAAPEAAILADLQGPKIRLGKFEGGTTELRTGAEFVITSEEVLGNAARASTAYRDLPRDVRPGDRILLADGAVVLRAISTDGTAVRCEVVSGGRIGDRKGINLPGVPVSARALTAKDREDLAFALARGVDFVALSFVRSRADLEELRALLPSPGPLVVAKIEKPEAWAKLEEILDACDGVMVARGDLGVEMPVDEVPYIQKSIIKAARRRGRFTITATQMLESMIEKPSPTRAEVSDVANAIFDGTDAVMLSGETSVGKYPVEAAAMMALVAEEADAHPEFASWEDLHARQASADAEIVASAAFQAASMACVRAIAVFTNSGATARLISRLRPPLPIYAFTPSEQVGRALRVNFDVHPVLGVEVRSADEMFATVDRILPERGWATRGDAVAIVASTNLLKIHRVGESTPTGRDCGG